MPGIGNKSNRIIMRPMASPGRESESLNIQLLVDSIPALIHTSMPDGYLDYFNKPWLEYLGAALEQVSGWNWTAFIHPEDVEGIVAKWRACLASGEVFEYETRVRRADGEYRWMFHRKVPLRDERGNIVKWYGSSLDIEERKRAEQALKRNEAYLAEAQKLSHTGSWAYDPATGKALYWSEEMFRICRLDPRHGFPNRDEFFRLVHPDDRDRVSETAQKGFREKVDFTTDYRLVLLDGTLKHLHLVWHPVLGKTGQVVEYVGTVADVTERKTAEEQLRRNSQALQRSEFYLAEGQRLGHMGSWAFDANGFDYWSPELFRMHGLDPAGKAPSVQEYLGFIHPEDRQSMADVINRLVAEATPFDATKRIVRLDGEDRYIRCVGIPFVDGQGLKKYVGSAIDVTEHELLTQELRRREADLAEAQRLSQTGSWAWSPDNDIRYWSEECYRVLSFDPHDGLPRFEEFFQRIHPDDQPGFRKLIETAIREKAEWQADYRIVHPDGPVSDIHVVGHPVLSPSGLLVEFVGTVIDVTERKRAEEARRRSEMELQQILDLAPQFIAVYGPNSERLYANRVALDYTGRSLEEWRQASDRGAYFHPDDRKRVLDGFNRGFSSGSVEEMEMRLRKGDGTYRWFFTRCVPLRDEKGHITRFYSVSIDIDDRKRAEERLHQENVALREEVDKASMFEEIVGTSPPLRTVLSRVSKVARSDSTVLITGETGTGKELVARAIHRRSARSSRAFVSVNCAAIPRDLIASELFGHEKGAFTGATHQRLGRFELANGGTIFLDEVGDLPPETQIALLRVLQEHEFERVGGTRRIRADVRVIAATNRELQAAIRTGSFRSDLFYRLHVFPIVLPPLRERGEDIALLVEYFIDRYARKIGKNIRDISKKTLGLLQSYPWPGNIRELQNVIERSVLLCETESFSIDESWLPKEASPAEPNDQIQLPLELVAQEKNMIEAALKESRGRVFGPAGAATKLGIPRSTLESKIRSLRIDKNRFKTHAET
jgi:PAS domain S-box-containing protein